MKKWWVLFFVLSFSSANAENPSFPGSMYPGFWGFMGSTLEKGSPSEESSPARRTDSLWLSVFWNKMNAIDDYNQYGLSSEWGSSNYRSAFLLSLLNMDSIYKTVSLSGELAFQRGLFNIGIGHLWRTAWVPGIDSWSTHLTKIGIHLKLLGGFSLGGLYLINFEETNQWWCGLHWSSDSGTLFFFELGQGVFNIGHSIDFGMFHIQSAFSYPGPQISVGLVLFIQKILFGIGFYRNSNQFSSESLHLNWNLKRK